MRHFLFEDKEYKIDPKFRRNRYIPDSAAALVRLIKTFKKGRANSGSRGSSSRRVDTRQKCVAKMQYSYSRDAHNVQLKKYLTREGTDRDGSNAKLYGTDIDEYLENMADKNYRIFLSPQSHKIDLKDLTEKFVETLEKQTGYSFYWQGANHYNTAHPHSHILINGVDKNGKEVEIPRDIVKTFMRDYARDICTAQIGHRTKAEIALERSKEPEALRYTRLDETIKSLGVTPNTIQVNKIIFDKERILARLENLRKIGLATFKNGAYKLDLKWEECLKANARYNTFLKARCGLEFTSQNSLKVYSGETGDISGKVTKIFRPDDDFSNNHAIIVESKDGNAYFIPLMKSPVMHSYKTKSRMGLMEGDIVSVKTFEGQTGRLTPVFFKNNAEARHYNQIN